MIGLKLSSNINKILNLLIKGERSLSEITKYLGISKPSSLKLLNNMENLGLISSNTLNTKIGREKKYHINSYSFIISIDPQRGVLIYQNNDSININNPLIGQVKQIQFRNFVNVYLKKIFEKLKKPFSAIIYGSIARGEATSKSDVDILLLSEKDWNENNKNSIMDALYEGSVETQIQAKPIFKTLNEFLDKKDVLNNRIKNDGLIVYDSINRDELWKAMKRYWNIIN